MIRMCPRLAIIERSFILCFSAHSICWSSMLRHTQHFSFSTKSHYLLLRASYRFTQINQTQQTCGAFFPPLSRRSLVKQNKSIINESELSLLILASSEEGGFGIYCHDLQPVRLFLLSFKIPNIVFTKPLHVLLSLFVAVSEHKY